eukprot:TRINITY_DN15298_c0_g1_i1.p1 TRINITY_DN15298_c0_g1~~TRINITY_DN15298_c0_g1_i1.p1  ORF type:complete len:118 (-),score=7.76 TRINITY_DN15298_c0_g1_i1:186-539(-)
MRVWKDKDRTTAHILTYEDSTKSIGTKIKVDFCKCKIISYSIDKQFFAAVIQKNRTLLLTIYSLISGQRILENECPSSMKYDSNHSFSFRIIFHQPTNECLVLIHHRSVILKKGEAE